ncbi:thioesterase II family protein [Streptomyces sp. NPDC101194]|uniref:thioesterase II family protein n=1 Tax=Streptomyces sp. NPDC101194 TaxID=3366127 RepID=UPI003814C0DB
MQLKSTGLKAKLVAETPYLWRARRPDARHRLICFPHAGGGAGVFAEWATLLPAEIELAAVQLPGRQNRIAEEAATEAGPLVEAVAAELLPVMDGPVAFFGHSCGAMLAFEVARFLHAAGGPEPVHLFLSAQPSPEAFRERPKLHELSHEDFRAEMVNLGGIDEEIVEDVEILDALLPAVRADFAVWERHRVAPVPRLDVPFSVLAGRTDVRTPLDSLDGWRAYTSARFDTRLHPGGHFYFLDASADVLASIGRTLLAS